jgi:NAD(P)-dependent dehydrogenase (short-subunit alcohol dehydrogenase family)
MIVGCDLTVDAAQATADMVRAAEGTMVSLQPCHLTKPADCQALVDFAVSTFGRPVPVTSVKPTIVVTVSLARGASARAS